MANSWGGNIISLLTVAFRVLYKFEYYLCSDMGRIYRNVSNFQQIIETPLPNQQNYIAISNHESALYAIYVDLYGDARISALKDKIIQHRLIQMTLLSTKKN
jgi:hypothetical protein